MGNSIEIVRRIVQGRNNKENSSRNSTVKSKEVRIDLVY